MNKLLRCFLCSFLFVSFAEAQTTGFVLRGKVTDLSGRELLIGATVQMLPIARGASVSLDGSYVFRNIPAGNYTVRFSYIGYQTKDTVVVLRANKTLNLSLTPAYASLSAVQIAGRQSRESEASARKSEQIAGNVMNIVSAKTIQLSPDVTVGNVMQRVPGVSVERSGTGEGRYAIIRGMDQRYNYTLINGIKIPSPDNRYRYVPLDIFPAELVERIEVNKTLTPDMEGDAIGGSVNMVMKNAPEQRYFNASLSTGASQNLINAGYDQFPVSAINKRSPYEQNGAGYLAKPEDFTRDNLIYTPVRFKPNLLASLSMGDRFFGGKLGVMLGGSYQNTFNTYQNYFNPAEFQEGGDLILKEAFVRNYSTQVTRTGINAKVDYQFNSRHRVSLYNFYALLDEAQARLTRDTLLSASRTEPGTGQVWYFGRSRFQRQNIYNSTLQGAHELLPQKLKLNWSGVYSKATNSIPDWAEYEYNGGYYRALSAPNDPPYQHDNVIQNFKRTWWKNRDRDLSGYVDLAYSGKAGTIPFTVTAGGMYRDKQRTNFYQSYELRPIPNTDGSNQIWSGIENFNWSVFNPAGSPAHANNYRSTEQISANYVMLKFRVQKLETIIGLRLENTDQRFETDVPVTQAAKTGRIQYLDKLPSVNWKYMLNSKTNLRLSYYASISRPGFFEIVPYSFQGENWTENGNPELLHTTANNFDFRYELFPRSNEQVLIGVFYKRITNPIEYGFRFTGVQNQTIYQPNNFGDATNYGLEFVYEKYIGRFGLRANYTYTNSAITTSKFTSERVDGILKPVYLDEKRPLQGQSAHIANGTLLYKDSGHGLDIQLTWQYTGKRIVLVAPYYGFDYWQKGMHLFDLSAEKRFAKKFVVFTKVRNLLNNKYEVYINKPPVNTVPAPFQDPASGRTLAERTLYGQNYQLGLRYIL